MVLPINAVICAYGYSGNSNKNKNKNTKKSKNFKTVLEAAKSTTHVIDYPNSKVIYRV